VSVIILVISSTRSRVQKRLLGVSRTVNGWVQVAIYAAIIAAITVRSAAYRLASLQVSATFLSPVLAPAEAMFYRLSGVDLPASRNGAPTPVEND